MNRVNYRLVPKNLKLLQKPRGRKEMLDNVGEDSPFIKRIIIGDVSLSFKALRPSHSRLIKSV